MIDEHYYIEPDWYLGNQKRYDSYDRKQPHVYLGEYASWGNSMKNAISEAAYLTGIERNGDVVEMASYAPLLAKKDHTQWKTDLIFFDNTEIIPTPNYYVQKLFMRNSGDYYYDKVINFQKADTTIAASCVYDSKTKDIIIKMVNAGKSKKEMSINLKKFRDIIPTATLTVLEGPLEAANNYEAIEVREPEPQDFQVNDTFDYVTPPMSLSVIRIKTKT